MSRRNLLEKGCDVMISAEGLVDGKCIEGYFLLDNLRRGVENRLSQTSPAIMARRIYEGTSHAERRNVVLMFAVPIPVIPTLAGMFYLGFCYYIRKRG